MLIFTDEMADLDTLIQKEEEKNWVPISLAGFAAGIVGEGMQLATEAYFMDYNWATGHLSDFGVVVQWSALLYGATSNLNRYLKTAASLIPPVISTIYEYAPLWNAENVTDHADTALFWLGWAASIGGIKYFASKKAKKEAEQEYEMSTSPLTYD